MNVDTQGSQPAHFFRSQRLPLVIMLLLLLVPVLVSAYDTLEYFISHGQLAIRRVSIAAVCTTGLIAMLYLVCKKNWGCRIFSARTAWWSLLASIIIILIINPQSACNPTLFSFALSLTLTCYLLIFAVFRQFSCIVWFTPLMVACIQYVSKFKYDVELTPAVIAEIIGASEKDIMVHITWLNVTILLAAAGAVLGSVYLFTRQLATLKSGPAFIVAFGMGLVVAANSVLMHQALWSVMPADHHGPEKGLVEIRHATHLATLRNEKLIQVLTRAASQKAQESSIAPVAKCRNVVCILHIGESVRADRLPFNGYHRNTMPFVNAQSSLINYNDCTSVAPNTLSAFASILTDAKGNIDCVKSPELLPTCGSMMDFFSANEFRCYAFMMGVSELKNRAIGECMFDKLSHEVFARSAEKLYDLPIGDAMGQLPQIRDVVAGNPADNLFFLLYNWGSHIPYNGYNIMNPPFTPADGGAHGRNPAQFPNEALLANNAYDCTIHYTDEYIRKVIEQIGDRPYIYVFIGDHGEYLGHDGKWNRSVDIDYYYKSSACNVPFFVIASPGLENLNEHFSQALNNLRKHQNMQVAHEHVFHTLLGLFGLQTQAYDRKLDLTSDAVVPYGGPHPSREGASIDGLKWY